MGTDQLVVATVVALLGAALWEGLRPVNVPRQANFEGIDDPAAARAYDWLSRLPHFSLVRQLMAWAVAARRPESPLVDVGCGPGYFTAKLARAFPDHEVIGVDLSEEMTRTAAANLSARGLGRVRFIQGDARELPFGDGSVGFLVSTLSLHHWADPVAAFTEFHRVLRPGGQVLVVDVRRDCPRLFYWLFALDRQILTPHALRVANEPIASALASYSLGELRAILRQTPFDEGRVGALTALSLTWARKG
jgi:ubiquinone/menaquinone biosynthesis C-methylase UbiE